MKEVPEKVYVELHVDDLYFRCDAELPTHMQLKDLKKGLLTLLREKEQRRFSSVREISVSYRGSPIPDTKTLADIGAWDGSILALDITEQ